ncbi:MAG: hypothetical protein JRN15_00555 [Nitrososphaerota archaeon]|nr:hypothetical protein [Nitrososphaerota archaeon]
MREAIICDDEGGRTISNIHDEELWVALESLLLILRTGSNFVPNGILEKWKTPHHQVSASEVYAWRASMEEIKNCDLAAKCAAKREDSLYSLMIDKPTMLKISGEITNALMHAYNSRHKISFNQNASKVPS